MSRLQKVGLLVAVFLAVSLCVVLRSVQEIDLEPKITDAHGQLTVKDGTLVDVSGEPFLLQGASTVNIGWDDSYIDQDIFETFSRGFHSNVIRIAVPVDGAYGYATAGDPLKLVNKVEAGIRYATELGLYVIVDWHVLEEGDPMTYCSDAMKFFNFISGSYASQDNILYEICNEPNGEHGDWETIREYANLMIPVIRANDEDAVVIVGTPEWSSDLTSVLENPLSSVQNVMYAYHFYAATHKERRREVLTKALTAGLPVIVTEFSLSEADGGGKLNTKQGAMWWQILDRFHVSRIAYSLSKQDASSSIVRNSCDSKTGWNQSDLTECGNWIRNAYTGRMEAVASSGYLEATDPSGSSIKAVAEVEDSWMEEGKTFTKIRVQLLNPGDQTVQDWRCELYLDEEPILSDSWSAEIESLAGGIEATPLDWNRVIEPGQNESFGLIVRGDEQCYMTALIITAEGADSRAV